MRKQMNVVLLFISSFLINSAGHAQFDKILKAGGKALDKSPTKLMEKYFSNAPITTSFDDVKTEVMLLGNFDPNESQFMPLSNLAQNANGNYIVTEGLYSATNKSFCLKAGTYGPSKGDGHLFAPLEGPKAFLVRKLLENWLTKEPDIPQRDVQCLIWAIIARTDVDKMDLKYKVTLARLLDKDDMAKLAANSLKDKALEAGMEKMRGEIPAEVYKVFEAERNLRNMYSRADATYDQFEQYAVLAGVAPAADMIRQVSKARWSYHPNGYFLRLTPHGYSSTTVDVYMPTEVVAATDVLGRIQSLSYDGEKIMEFNYGNEANTSENILSAGITEVKFLSKEFKQSVKLQTGHTLNFVKPDFPFSNAGSGKASQFVKWLNTENGSIVLNLDQSTKSNLFNLMNAIQSFETLPENSMDPRQNSFVRHLLNEAYNYSVYKNLSINEGKGYQRNRLIEPDKEYWVITNQPVDLSGPLITGNNTENQFLDNNADRITWKQDKGELDFPNTVATPANRSSQRIGQSKPPKEPPWYEKLPDCPCTYKEAQNLANTAGSGWLDCAGANQDFHYGASTEVRWAPSKPGKPGQQCTYDANGDLITSGIGAGSPDHVSPHGCESTDINWNSIQSVYGHTTQDVKPWGKIPCKEYLRDWPANNGKKCSPDNPAADIKHMPNLVGDMTCEEITKLLQQANAKNSKISPDLRKFLNGDKSVSYTESQLHKEMVNWYRSEGCPGKDPCRVIADATVHLNAK